MTLSQTPADILFLILRYLDLLSISRLSQTCRILNTVIESYGWNVYAIQNPLPSPSLTPALTRWTMHQFVRTQTKASTSWDRRRFITRPLGPEWFSKFQPVLTINGSRLVVGAGNTLFLYKFSPPSSNCFEAPRVRFENTIRFPRDPKKDISGIAFHGDDIIISFVHGALGRTPLPEISNKFNLTHSPINNPEVKYFTESGPAIKDLSVCNNLALTMNSSGCAALYSLSEPISPLLSSVAPPARCKAGWSSHLSLQSSSGYAVLGTASMLPLAVHSLTQTQIEARPQTILYPYKGDISSHPTAVYCITGATKAFPWTTPSDQIVISGWYHGAVTLHDLRCPTSTTDGQKHALLPSLTLRDPLTTSGIYSLSSAGNHIAAGAAEYSLLQLYDVRSPKNGFSIYLPQGRVKSSPVYACILESTRIWAATDSHSLVVDFGPVNNRTYPSLNRYSSRDKSIGWNAPIYNHFDPYSHVLFKDF
ncbi:hypothetical protein BU17DRAFT_47592 [Hysterangium stoloniferum]|nr:hypothetical protein BU17DRAFT_47592 [Hysterangium stoloniferum]